MFEWGISMDLAAIAVGLQQASLQQNIALTVLKQNAQQEQALVQMTASVAGGRGQALDISV
jgi:hypothetical protein